jgi:hypothetical protein
LLGKGREGIPFYLQYPSYSSVLFQFWLEHGVKTVCDLKCLKRLAVNKQ